MDQAKLIYQAPHRIRGRITRSSDLEKALAARSIPKPWSALEQDLEELLAFHSTVTAHWETGANDQRD